MDSYYISHNNNISIATIWINGGSSLDKAGQKGINQILTSLLTRGCKGYDNFLLSEFIASHGAELNYETNEDGIILSIKSIEEYFEKLFPLLNLIIEEPTLENKEFLNCKKKIVNTIIKSRENPFNLVFDNWRKIVYSSHPYSFESNGYEKDIRNIKYLDILKEYRNFKRRKKYLLTNNNKTNFTNLKLIDISNKELEKDVISSTILPNIDRNNFISSYSKANQIIIMLGNQTCPHFKNDYLTLKLLESHLSFGMSSLLFKVFREKNGLTYDIGIFNPTRRLNSPFLVYLSVSVKNAFFAFETLLNQWQNLSNNLITEKELSLAKVKLRAFLINSYQTVEETITRKVQLISYGLDPKYDKICMNRIENISAEEIKNIAKKYFDKSFLSISGDKETCEKIKYLWYKKQDLK